MPADISKFRQKAQKKIRLSREEMKRLDKDYDRYAISRDRASVAGLLPGNTNRDAWASKYIEMETTTSNIRRYERAGNYLRYTPALRQALHEQADRLKAKPEQIEEEMAELKRQGKHDDALTRHHLHQQRQDRQRYRAEIKKHRKLLSQNE